MIEVFELPDEAATRALGAQIVRALQPSDVVLLLGELGAGKTTLVRGALAVLGWIEAVRSPTYNLIAEYETDPPVLHADLYRLETTVDDFGLCESMVGRICFIEWPERMPSLIALAAKKVTIEFHENGRRASVEKLSNQD